jgi:hypothetical protein
MQRVFLLTHSLTLIKEVKMKKYLISIAAFLFAFIPVSSANAESAWRYWSYWQINGGVWEMAMTGAADVKAEDGQVQGWRYITAGIDISEEFAPRTKETFESICADVEAKDGIARIALVVDFGDASDYSNQSDADSVPSTKTACVEINAGDPSSLILSSAFETREESGMVCGVVNLPSSGCGEEVDISSVTTKELLTTSVEDENVAPLNFYENSSFQLLIAGAFVIGLLALVLKKKQSK